MQAQPILVAKNGPNQGFSYLITEKTTIGRDKENSIPIDDQLISRRHCVIWQEEGTFKIKDLDSKNGTFVNNLKINEAFLNPEDTITLGNTTFFFLIGPAGKTSRENIKFSAETAKQTLIIQKLPVSNISDVSSQLLSKLSQDKAIKDLSALYHISFSIYTVRDTDKLLARVLELIFKTVPVEHGVILLCEEKNGGLEPAASRTKEGEPKTEIKISRTIAEEAFKEKIAILTKDAQSDKRFSAKESIIQEAIRSAICVPISTAQKTFGVIYLDTKTFTAEFNEETLRLITAISNMTAIAIENIRFHQDLKNGTETLSRELKQVYNMVGISSQIKDVFGLINKVAPTESNILITGESGTGKELVARAIHYNSPRKLKPFICVNCTAIPETLIESDLFGHEKGAFTGAYTAKPGQFELSNNGTIFLDEIGEMPLSSQMKLLRVLEENKIRRVGGTKDIPVNVRILAASNKNLEKAVKDGSFREDLFYRIKVISINMAPLRERPEDIPIIARYYFEIFRSKTANTQLKGFSDDTIEVMKNYPWPGNVRELKNCIERAMVLCKKNLIDPDDLGLPEEEAVKSPSEITTLSENERQHIIKALGATKGNKTKAAEILGIQRSTLYEKIKLHKIE